MNLTKGKRAAAAGLGIFLVFMGICTVAAKGIYRAGLAQITAQTPYSGSLVHEIKTNGTVKQGQEYGIFTESGLRIAAVEIRRGEYFEEGEALFQVDMEDLQAVIEEKELELEKLTDQWEEHLWEERETGREQQRTEVRAREDYDNTLREADARVDQCRQALDGAAQELALYDQYLLHLSQNGSQVSGGNAATSPNNPESPDDGISDAGVKDPAQQYSQQEKRHQLLQNVAACSQALEDAERSRETALQSAARAVEDAGNSLPGDFSGDWERRELEYREKELLKLKELSEKEGWVYSRAAGRVTDCRVAVGERTQDGAGILYATDDGERIIEAVFTEDNGRYLTLYAELSLKTVLPGGRRIQEKVSLNYMETLENGGVLAEIPADGLELEIGQNVELSYRMQTDNYITCVPALCVHNDEQGGNYVYVAEEREGILGAEWRVRKVVVSILDRTDSVVAVESGEITTETRIVISTEKPLNDGDVVRLVH